MPRSRIGARQRQIIIERAQGCCEYCFIATAVAEKLSALMTESYLQQRARQGSRAHYDAALARVPHAEPAEYDRIEEDLGPSASTSGPQLAS